MMAYWDMDNTYDDTLLQGSASLHHHWSIHHDGCMPCPLRPHPAPSAHLHVCCHTVIHCALKVRVIVTGQLAGGLQVEAGTILCLDLHCILCELCGMKSHGSHTTGTKSHVSHMTGSKSHGSHMTGLKSHESHMTGSKSHGSHMTGSKSHGSHTTGTKSHDWFKVTWESHDWYQVT